MKLRVLLLALLLVVLPEVALAQIPDLNSLLPPGNGSTSGRIIQLMAVITVLSVAAVGVYALLKLRRRPKDSPGASPAAAKEPALARQGSPQTPEGGGP